MPRLSEALEGQREDVLYFVHSSVQKSFTGLYTADLRESSCWPKTFMKKEQKHFNQDRYVSKKIGFSIGHS